MNFETIVWAAIGVAAGYYGVKHFRMTGKLI
jgi:hypothetical protein